MRLSLEDRLRIEGLNVVTATTVEGACLLLVHGGRPSLVVTDMRLPDGMGDRVFETCRERHPGVPVIVMTAFGSVLDAVRLVKAGALDYVEKPFDLDEFVDMVRVTIASGHSGRPRSSRQRRRCGTFSHRRSAREPRVGYLPNCGSIGHLAKESLGTRCGATRSNGRSEPTARRGTSGRQSQDSAQSSTISIGADAVLARQPAAERRRIKKRTPTRSRRTS